MYDTYYQTRVNMRWGRSPAGAALGIVLFLLGLCAIIFSAVDVSNVSVGGSNPLKPNRRATVRPGENPERNIGTLFCDYSIWATLGKGIWVGLLFMTTGVVAICSQRERTSKAIAATTILAATSAIFGLFLMLASIPQLQKYQILGPNDTRRRNDKENSEYVLNSLLISVGIIGFLVSLLLSCLGCVVDSCTNNRRLGPRGPLPPTAFGPPAFGGAPPIVRRPPGRFLPR